MRMVGCVAHRMRQVRRQQYKSLWCSRTCLTGCGCLSGAFAVPRCAADALCDPWLGLIGGLALVELAGLGALGSAGLFLALTVAGLPAFGTLCLALVDCANRGNAEHIAL